MRIELMSESEKREWEDMKACHEAIKKAREIRKTSRNVLERNLKGVTHTHIPIQMWEVLQEVIENERKTEKSRTIG